MTHRECPEYISRLRELFSYCPDTGIISRLLQRGPCRQGSEAGTPALGYGTTYRKIKIDGTMYRAHRVAWALHYGVWPVGLIDHINKDGADNRIANLRLATHSQNAANSGPRSGRALPRGVVFDARSDRYYSYGTKNYKKTYLGCFKNQKSAEAAYAAWSRENNGEFA